MNHYFFINILMAFCCFANGFLQDNGKWFTFIIFSLLNLSYRQNERSFKLLLILPRFEVESETFKDFLEYIYSNTETYNVPACTSVTSLSEKVSSCVCVCVCVLM